MFGYFKWKRAVNDAVHYCTTMFAGLDMLYGKPVPTQVFGDAYVAGFLQQLIMHAVQAAGLGKVPDAKTMISAAEATYERLVPGLGKQLMEALGQVNQPTHPGHTNYQVGRREGKEYVMGLLNGDEDLMRERMTGFREFVVRNYMGVKYTG